MAFSSVGFLSSIRPSGRPLTKSTAYGLRLRSTTVNWLTASQSFFAGFVVENRGMRAAHGAVGEDRLNYLSEMIVF